MSFFNHVRSTYPKFQQPELSLEDFNLNKLIDFHLIHNSDYPFGILSDDENQPCSQDAITWNEIGSGIIKVVQQLSPCPGGVCSSTSAHQLPLSDKGNSSAHVDERTWSGHGDSQNIRHSSSPEMIGIISSDEPLSHFTILLGILKSGFIPFVISPHNSPEAIAHLLRESGCKNVFVQYNPNDFVQSPGEIHKNAQDQMEEVVKLLSPDHPINLLESLDTFQLFPRLINSTSYEINNTLPDQLAKLSSLNQPHHIHTPIIYYHTSGTTGFPKLVPINRLTFHALLTSGLHTNFPWSEQLISAMTLPPYHNMGAHVGLDYLLSQGSVSAFYRPEGGPDGRSRLKTLSSKSRMRAMRNVGSTVAVFSPMMLTEWASDPESVDYLKSIERVAFGGKPLSIEIGNQLNEQGVKLSTMYGATEVGAIAKLFPEPSLGDNWEYFEMSSQVKPQLKKRGENEYELIILSSDQHRCSLSTNDDFGPQSHHTRDLLAKHPSLPLYRVLGRLDDQISLSNSKQINPAALEAILTTNPAIKGALLFGEGKPRIGVIIEIEETHKNDQNSKTHMNQSQFMKLIWPSIQSVNQHIPYPNKITQKTIIITNPKSKPLPKTLKGTISRSKALQIFSEKIEKVYTTPSSSSSSLQREPKTNLRLVQTYKESLETCGVSIISQGYKS